MSNDLAKKTDITNTGSWPEQQLEHCDIEFVFTNLNTKLWRNSRLLIQRRADIFAYSPDKTRAYAGFMLTTKTASKIQGVYLRIYNWKTVYVHVKGSDVDTLEEVKGWLYCLLRAFESGHPETYCALDDYDPAIHTDADMWMAHVLNPDRFQSDNITIPCRNVRWRPDIRHPDRYKQDYMDAAVETGCHRCPLFNIDRFCKGPKPKQIAKKAPGRT